tara:strand:+ start:809 stop:1711 length:903 start_codon:yes stop_codon:yes gene_type:complete
MLETLVKRCHHFPEQSKLLIFGGGFTGQHIAALARQLGAQVICSRRKKNSPGADFIFNSSTHEIPSKSIFNGVTHLLSCIPPDNDGRDPVIKHLKDEVKNMSLKWAGYLSTTGVYGDSKGEWVGEENLPKPEQARSKRRYECEKEWQSLKLPLQILRLPGIYGPGRSAFESIINKKCRLIDKPGQIFSRIHIDDIAGATMHLISLSEKGIKPNIVNISDNLPSANIEVLRYAAQLIKISLPSIESFETASKSMSPIALSFWKENRRVSNKLLCEILNYSLVHSNYKDGLKDCLFQLNYNK